ncbi:MAG: hypothetical protein AMK72_04650 [Planctomycetes bacterium SM23_25]|jgi:predicted membrane channel-forming protein YqfA (hemolysin III family)|nr:MAG: hypothetical protein AMK72_04650 [Planctomycetes bacterium SM23_25]
MSDFESGAHVWLRVVFAVAIAVSAWRGYRRTRVRSFVAVGSLLVLWPWIVLNRIGPPESPFVDLALYALLLALMAISFGCLAHAFRKAGRTS